MDIKKLQTLVVDALEDVKGQDIVVFDTTHLTSLFDRIAIVSGTSNRQTKALAASVRDKVKDAGGDIIGMEGEDTGEWVLVDLGDMIVHIMQPAIRAVLPPGRNLGRQAGQAGRRQAQVDRRRRLKRRAEAKSKHLAATQAKVGSQAGRRAQACRPSASHRRQDHRRRRQAAAEETAPRPLPRRPVGKTVKVAPTKTEDRRRQSDSRQPPKRAVQAAAPAKRQPMQHRPKK